jgi:tetratricopeptide (TPR) repeat protein
LLDVTANNALGAALIASGQLDRALAYLQSAARTSPEYSDAHYNLGNMLASAGDFPRAAEQFATAVRLKPDDADAHVNLGPALAELGRFPEAEAQFERALETIQRMLSHGKTCSNCEARWAITNALSISKYQSAILFIVHISTGDPWDNNLYGDGDRFTTRPPEARFSDV